MTPTIWLIVFMGNYDMPDFYINHVPFWSDKSRTYFSDPLSPYDRWEEECRKFHQPEAVQYILADSEEDYD